MDIEFLILVFWLIIGPLVGAAIGDKKGRGGAGLVMGFLIGPFGWLLVALGPDKRPKCPFCRKALPDEEASICAYCRSPLKGNGQPAQP